MSSRIQLENRDWKQLLVDSQNGNRDSYRILLERIYQLGNTFLLKRISQPQIREELLQEAVLSIHRGLASYDRSYSAKAWVYSVLKNKLIDYFRKLGKEELDFVETEMLLSFADPSGSDQDGVASRQWLGSVLQNIPQTQRQVFFLIQVDGLEITEVATRLNISSNNVKVLLHRARAALKDRYISEGGLS